MFKLTNSNYENKIKRLEERMDKLEPILQDIKTELAVLKAQQQITSTIIIGGLVLGLVKYLFFN